MRKNLLLGIFLIFFSFVGFAQTVEFFDDFESGTTNWVLTSTWGLTTTYAASPTNSLTDSPGGNYANSITSYATMANGVDLTGDLSAQLTFKSIFSLENGFDYVYVQVSTDNFATFTTIATLNGENNLTAATPWDEYSYSLGGFLNNANVKVRIKFVSDQGYVVDGIYVDDFKIVSSNVDNQPPLVLYTPPQFYEGTLGPYTLVDTLVDISGISSTKVNFSCDGVVQPTNVVGTLVSGTTYSYTIPYQIPGTWVDFWITATDNSTLQNTIVTDTFHYIAGNYIGYDDGIVDYYFPMGPGSTQPSILGCAVQITVPASAPNIVTALIRNYTDANNPNDQMQVHIWDSDISGGVGADLIPPILMYPECTLTNTSAMTRIDLRPYAYLLNNQAGDIYVGFTIPSGIVNVTEGSPAVVNRTFTYDGSLWSNLAGDFFFRAITSDIIVGTNDQVKADYFNVYPNPMTDKTTVRVISTRSLNDMKLLVFNILGEQVNAGVVKTTKGFDLYRDNLPTGTYLYKILDKGDILTQGKIIVQ